MPSSAARPSPAVPPAALAAPGPSAVAAALTRPATYLRVVFLLLGSALAVSFVLLDVTLIALVADLVDNGWLVLAAGVVLVAVPPVALGLMSPVRQVEAVAAQSLLGVRFPDGPPGPSRTLDQRVRAAAWFLSHVVAGGLVAFAFTWALGLGPALLAAPFTLPAGGAVLGVDWLRTTGGWGDAWLVAAGLASVAGAVVVPVLLGAAMARLAPALLGPSYAERLHRLEAETARLAERNRIAREIHDSVGHALSLVTLQAGAARKLLDRDPEFVARALDAIESASRAATGDLDHVLGLLRAPEDAARREPAPGLAALPALLAATRAAGLEVEAHLPGPATGGGDLDGLPGVVSREAYRIVQEGLTNALRYATGPARLSVTRPPERLVIELTNPTRTGPRKRTGRGLSGIAERVSALGGVVHSGVDNRGDDGPEPVDTPVDAVDKPVENSSRPAGGRTWRLRVELPLPEDGA